MKEEDKAQFPKVTHYTQVYVQPGGINIQYVEHLHQAKILKDLGIEADLKGDEKTIENSKSEEKQESITNCIQNGKDEFVEIPSSVSDVFAQPAFIEKYVRAMIENYYSNSPLSLALIYCVLNDYTLIKRVGDYKKIVKALIDWGMLPSMTDKQLKTLANGVSAFMRDRMDHGKLRTGLSTDFRHWIEPTKKKQCENIASVFGKEDDYNYPDGKLHYKYKNNQ